MNDLSSTTEPAAPATTQGTTQGIPQATTPALPVIERVRHELKRRTLTVRTVEYVTPQMLRITLTSDDLGDFASASADDHIKIFPPNGDREPEGRDYTPRYFNTDDRTLVLDFAIHEAGPATAWAIEAKPGTTLPIGGPRGSAVVSGVNSWLLIGDETALPAIGRRIEEAGEDDSFIVIAAVAGPEEEQRFETKARVDIRWVHRPLSKAADAAPLVEALSAVETIPAGTFAWIAAEASVARAVRADLTENRGHPLPWLKAAGYWTKGKADAAEKDV
jgi:NADPH-dependent ferric siderophore reductase